MANTRSAGGTFEDRAKALIDDMSRNAATVTRSLGLPREAEIEVFSTLYSAARKSVPHGILQWVSGAARLVQLFRVIPPNTVHPPPFSLALGYMGDDDEPAVERTIGALGPVEILETEDSASRSATLTFRLRAPYPDDPTTVLLFHAHVIPPSLDDDGGEDEDESDSFVVGEVAALFVLSAEEPEISTTIIRADFPAAHIEVE